jgi:hypothetical protein
MTSRSWRLAVVRDDGDKHNISQIANVNKILRVASKVNKQMQTNKQTYMQSTALGQGNQSTTRERWESQIINDESCSIPDYEQRRKQ